MSRRPITIAAFAHTSIFIVLTLVFVLTWRTAHAATPLLPNLKALPAADLTITTDGSGNQMLLLSTTSWNAGAGPLELRGGEVVGGKQRVYQRIKQSDGTFVEETQPAGTFTWHAQHNHFHFDDYAIYSLQSVANPGNPQRFSSKMTFCILDTYVADLTLPGAPQQPFYRTCNNDIQGMSVGWGDTYLYYLFGQSIDITGLPDGDYFLKVEVDPKNGIIESDDTDNTSTIVVHIGGGGMTVGVNDSDGDGCNDAQELGLDEVRGGRRDPNNAWDFFDVNASRSIDLSDALAILGAFGAGPGNPEYVATYDRVAGPADARWRTAQATGGAIGIDLQDVLANLQGFGHNCA
jgi:hypothetical protein